MDNWANLIQIELNVFKHRRTRLKIQGAEGGGKGGLKFLSKSPGQFLDKTSMGLRYFGFYLGLLLHFYLQAFQKFAWGAQCAKTLQKVQKPVFETKIFF